MKTFNIAVKDLLHTFRSPFSLVMMFVAPLLITGLLYFAFGSMVSGNSGPSIPVTEVQIVNLDQSDSSSNSFSAGNMLVDFLRGDDLKDVINVTVVDNEDDALAEVDKQAAGVALIIPPEFSQAVLESGHKASVVFYQDPTLTIGPGIVKDLVNHFLDGFSGSKIAADVTAAQLTAANIENVDTASANAAQQYAAWLQSSEHGEGENSTVGLTIMNPQGENQSAQQGSALIAPIMAGMMIFFVFYMGANGAQTIIREDEDGTLARLNTTPASTATILGGKFLGVLVTLIIQTIVLLAAAILLFRINWGQPISIVLVTSGMIVAATGFGIMVMSFIKNSRQTGPVLGGVLVITGMLGGLFTNGIPDLPAAFDKIILSMPQGWAMHAWKLTLSNAAPAEVLLPTVIMFLLGAAFLGIGILFFRRRFA